MYLAFATSRSFSEDLGERGGRPAEATRGVFGVSRYSSADANRVLYTPPTEGGVRGEGTWSSPRDDG